MFASIICVFEGSFGNEKACKSCAAGVPVQTCANSNSPRILCKLVQIFSYSLCACILGRFGRGKSGLRRRRPLGNSATVIRTAQVRTAMAGNASMLMLYWEIGGVLVKRQKNEGWGTAVLPRLATDLHNDLPEVKGFSARNLRLMIQFFDKYPAFGPIWQRAVAKLSDDSTGGKKGRTPVAQLSAEFADAQIWQRTGHGLQISDVHNNSVPVFHYQIFVRSISGGPHFMERRAALVSYK